MLSCLKQSKHTHIKTFQDNESKNLKIFSYTCFISYLLSHIIVSQNVHYLDGLKNRKMYIMPYPLRHTEARTPGPRVCLHLGLNRPPPYLQNPSIICSRSASS